MINFHLLYLLYHLGETTLSEMLKQLEHDRISRKENKQGNKLLIQMQIVKSPVQFVIVYTMF